MFFRSNVSGSGPALRVCSGQKGSSAVPTALKCSMGSRFKDEGSQGAVLTPACELGRGTPPQGSLPGPPLWTWVFGGHLFWGRSLAPLPCPLPPPLTPSLACCSCTSLSWEETAHGAPSRLKSTCGRCGGNDGPGLFFLHLGDLAALGVAFKEAVFF